MNKEQVTLLGEIFNGKKVFLTGHTGFKGSWMLVWLNMLGAKVKGYALAPDSDNALFNEIGGESLCESIIADIRDQKRLNQEIKDFEPDFVFHLAAQPLVRLSYDIPLETFDINVMGSAYVLNAVRFLPGSCVALMITTDKVYENKEWIYPYRENDALGGYDPYSASKAAAEIVCNSFRSSFLNLDNYKSHQKSVATVRAGNVIGGGDWAKDRIVPDLIRAFSKQEPLLVRNPDAVRPWQHVMEPIGGYLLLGALMHQNPLEYSSAWNFGPLSQDALSVKELTAIAKSVWGSGDTFFPPLENQPHEAGLLKLDISKSGTLLKWTPKYKAEESIRLTINWYKERLAGKSALELVEQQIKEYIS